MTPLIRPIKQSKLNCKKKNNHPVGSSDYRTPQLNNRAENQTVKKKPQNLGCFFDVHTTLMMRLIMRYFYYPII